MTTDLVLTFSWAVRAGQERAQVVPSPLAHRPGGRQAGSLPSQRWPGFSALPSPAHSVLCPLLSHAQPGRVTGVDLAAFPASSLKKLWLLPPEVASLTSGPVGLSKVLTLKQGWGWEGKDKRQKGAGAWEALPFPGSPGGWGFLGTCHIHSLCKQSRAPPSQKCDSRRHHEGLEGKERLDSNSKEEDQANR